MLLAEGCDISVLVRCSHHCEATITRWLERAGKHSSLLHIITMLLWDNRLFRNLVLTFVQMDELYCRVRRTGKIWVWLAIDPVTISSQRFYGKILPSRLMDCAGIFTLSLLISVTGFTLSMLAPIIGRFLRTCCMASLSRSVANEVLPNSPSCVCFPVNHWDAMG
jgi:hypothetical protein